MKKAASITAALSVALVLVSGSLQAAPKATVVIEDPMADANFLNDQGTGDGSFGDVELPASAGTVSDLLEVQMANDAKNLYVTILTQAAPPAATAIGYRVRTNPDGAAGSYCLLFEAFYPGAQSAIEKPVAHLVDACNGNETTELEVQGTTLIVPRSANEAFGKGGELTAAQAQSFLHFGSYPAVIGPMADTTTVQGDFKFVDKKKKRKR